MSRDVSSIGSKVSTFAFFSRNLLYFRRLSRFGSIAKIVAVSVWFGRFLKNSDFSACSNFSAFQKFSSRIRRFPPKRFGVVVVFSRFFRLEFWFKYSVSLFLYFSQNAFL